jgi:hypothetical protein
LAAAVALLIGGDLAARGPGALLDVWRFLFPYLWLFLAFEALRRRRRLLDEEAFLIGAAVGLAHDGILVKILQDGIFFLGINWLSALTACFDWGMVTVVALHAADALLPRPAESEPAAAPGTLELAALVFLPAGAFMMYAYDALVGRARFERMLGPAWLLADLLFAAAAAALVRRALARSEAVEPEGRERWLWALGVFCAWLPGAQLAARAGGPELSLISFVYAAAWTGLVGAWTWRLWRERGRADWSPRRAARPLLGLAAWRLAGSLLAWLIFGALENGGRGASVFAFFVDLPTRLVFLSLFFSSRLAV